MSYDYPGNVRELINLLERATVFENPDFATIIAENRAMTANLRNTSAFDNNPASNVVTETTPAASKAPVSNEAANSADIPDELDAAIRLHVRRVYEKYGHNLTKTAEALQIAKNTLKKYLNR
jgi:two-component system NtrC family response regulator